MAAFLLSSVGDWQRRVDRAVASFEKPFRFKFTINEPGNIVLVGKRYRLDASPDNSGYTIVRLADDAARELDHEASLDFYTSIRRLYGRYLAKPDFKEALDDYCESAWRLSGG